MENAPLKTESNSEASETSSGDKKESKKKKKTGAAEALGAFVIEPEKQHEAKRDDAAEKRDDFWSYFKAPENETEKADTSEATKKEKAAPLDTEQAVAARLETALEASQTLGETPVDDFSAAEEQAIEQVLVEAAPEDGNEVIQAFRAKISQEGKDSDTSLEETFAEFDLDAEPEADTASDMSEPGGQAAQEFGDEAVIFSQAETTEAGEPKEEAKEDESEASSTTSASPTPPPQSAAGGSGGTRPPVPPTTQGGPGQPPFGGSGGASFNAPPVQPVMANANQAPIIIDETDRYDRGNPAAAALLGGIIGYFIGRRRGRIKTEKRLLPVQKKLEKRVDDLQWQLQAKEQKLRQAVRQKAALAVEVGGAVAAVADHIENFQSEAQNYVAQEAASTPVERRAAAVEAHQLHGGKQAREQIGHILVQAETPQKNGAEKSVPKPEAAKPTALAPEKHVDTMNRAELMRLSDKIIIDGSSLRQIYETHLVGERGLRRLVAEHLRGGDLKKALRREITEREIDFERDPVMRDHPAQATSNTSGGSKALNDLLQKAGANTSNDSEEVKFLKARADYETKQQAQQKKRQRSIDISLTVGITILLVVIAVLIITH